MLLTLIDLKILTLIKLPLNMLIRPSKRDKAMRPIVHWFKTSYLLLERKWNSSQKDSSLPKINSWETSCLKAMSRHNSKLPRKFKASWLRRILRKANSRIRSWRENKLLTSSPVGSSEDGKWNRSSYFRKWLHTKMWMIRQFKHQQASSETRTTQICSSLQSRMRTEDSYLATREAKWALKYLSSVESPQLLAPKTPSSDPSNPGHKL